MRPQTSTGTPTERRNASLTADAVTGVLKEMLWATNCPAKRYIQLRRRTIMATPWLVKIKLYPPWRPEWREK